jgi:hypothetical protein
MKTGTDGEAKFNVDMGYGGCGGGDANATVPNSHA